MMRPSRLQQRVWAAAADGIGLSRPVPSGAPYRPLERRPAGVESGLSALCRVCDWAGSIADPGGSRFVYPGARGA